MVRCEVCGGSQPSGATFCGRCGAQLSVESTSKARPRRAAVVVVLVVVGLGVAALGSGLVPPVAVPRTGAVDGGVELPSSAPEPSDPPTLVPVEDEMVHVVDPGCDADVVRSLVCPTWAVTANGGLGQPVLVDRQVLVGTSTGVVPLTPWSGRPSWSVGLGAAVSGAPTTSGMVAFVLDDLGGLTALDRRSGTTLWHVEVGATRTRPIVVDGTVVVAGFGQVVGLRVDDGRRRWSLGIEALPSPLTSDAARVFVGDGAGVIRAVDAATGEVRWQREVDGWATAPAADNVLLVTGFGQPLRALDTRTGEDRWQSDLPIDGAVPLVAADRSIAYVQVEDRLLEIDPATGASHVLAGELDGLVALDDIHDAVHVLTAAGRLVTLGADGAVQDEPAPSLVRWLGAAPVDGASWLVASIEGGARLVGAPAPMPTPPGLLEDLEPGDPCPVSPLADRSYSRVVVGDHVEIAGPGTGWSGETFLIDPGAVEDRPLTLTGRQLDGDGRMGFRTALDAPPVASLVVDGGARGARGWPPHWGLQASVSAPGCWSYVATTRSGAVDELVVEIDRSTFAALDPSQRQNPADLR